MAIIRPIGALLFVVAGLLTLTLREQSIGGILVAIPAFGSPSLATKFFLAAESFLIPAGVSIVALGPVSAFVAPIAMAFLLAFLITFPYVLYSFVCFITPAIQEGERRTLYAFLLPSLALFYLGCAFAYFLLIPETFSILYSFATPIGVTPLFSLDSFISSVFLLTTSVGLVFLFPVAMVMLTRLSVLPRGFWLKHWRSAVMCSVIFSAIITPDGSGVTMLFLLVPVALLYATGAFLSSRNFAA